MSETPKRDPRQDPQPGDVVKKLSPTGNTITRTVSRRVGNTVYYRAKDGGKEINCWITTWWEWCRTADEPKQPESEIKTAYDIYGSSPA